jgi:PEP-CTERM motif
MIRTSHVSFVFVVVCCGFCSSAQAAVTFNIFTNPHPPMTQGTVGFAYAGNKFVGSVLQNGTGSLYSTDLNGGNVQVFAPTVGLTSTTAEHFVAASFGLGGFPNGDIYAADGSNIVHITNNGAASNTFVTGLTGEVRGITFDLVGTFNKNMLVTTTSGNVYRISSAGAVTPLANVGEDVEGLDVAPLGNNFATFDGQLIVASEGSGKLRAISSGGVVTDLSNGSLGPILINNAEELTFVPLNLGASLSPLEGLYGANFMPNVLKANGNQFVGMQGDIIVTSEIGAQVRDVHWNGSQFVVTQIGSFPSQPEDGVFVTPTMVSLGVPEPSSITLAALGIIALAVVVVRSRLAG